MPPCNSDTEAPTPVQPYVGGGGEPTREAMKGKWGHEGETQTQQDWCPYRKGKRHQTSRIPSAHMGSSCVDTVKRWRRASQRELSLAPGPAASRTERK